MRAEGVRRNQRFIPATRLWRAHQWTSLPLKSLGKVSRKSIPRRERSQPGQGSPIQTKAARKDPREGDKSLPQVRAQALEDEWPLRRTECFVEVHQDAPFGATGGRPRQPPWRREPGASAQAEVDTSALEAENPVTGSQRRTKSQDPRSRPGKANIAPAPRRKRK